MKIASIDTCVLTVPTSKQMALEFPRQQPGTPAYCRDLEAAALRRALAEADPSRIAVYRAEEEARIRRYIAAQAH